MLWQEQPDSRDFIVPDDILDLSFRMECRELPVDHAWALSHAIAANLPWFKDEPCAAIHTIHGAASGNGWIRPPEQPGSLLLLSRRSRLHLRLPKHRCDDARALCGTTLDIAGYSIKVGDCQKKALVPSRTIFSRSVCCTDSDDEQEFTRWIAEKLHQQGINVSKMLCGLSHTVMTPDRILLARSVLLADLDLEQSIYLQQHGFGPERTMGCGVFLPHKSLAAVGTSQHDD